MSSSPDERDPDWPRYPETILRFATEPAIEIDLRAIPSAADRAGLRAAGLKDSFAVMTAFDPGGRNLPASENERRQLDLERRLNRAGHRYVEVDACSPDGSHCECSVAVVMPQEQAVALARELEQVAIFWFDGARFWIVGVIVEADPLMLPRSS
jgi:hypothetical protein